MDLAALAPFAVAFLSGGGVAVVAVQWLKGRVKLEKHWTATTIELVDALRVELKGAKDELAALRPVEVRLAHFAEALDHIHDLLASTTVQERATAERRARDFLTRMGMDERLGQRRQEAQADASIDAVVEDFKKGGTV